MEERMEGTAVSCSESARREESVVVEEARPAGGKRGAALEEVRAAKPQVPGAWGEGGPADTSSEEALCTVGSLPRRRRTGGRQE